MIGHHTVLKAKFGTPPVGGEKCPVSLARMCSGNAVPPHGQIVPLIAAWRASVAANQRAALRHSNWHKGCSGTCMCCSQTLLWHMCGLS